MVGTPQLPLKYRRKAVDNFTDIDVAPYPSCTVGCVEHDMVHYTASYSAPVPNLGASFDPVSFPQSPVLSSHYEPSSSSPPRSLYTPEPPSSPLSDPFIASSSSSPRSKHFWDVAFNYGPGFPYRPRPFPVVSKIKSFQSSPTDSEFNHDHPIYSHRRSLSESAPTLMSDMDASEFSEDIEVMSIEGDIPNLQGLEAGKHVGIHEDIGHDSTSEEGICSAGHVDLKAVTDDCALSVGVEVDIDIAATLLDLSRQVRITSSDARKKPAPIAVEVKRTEFVSRSEKDSEVKEEPTTGRAESPVLPVSGVAPTCPSSSATQSVENQTIPIAEDAYMRRDDVPGAFQAAPDREIPDVNILSYRNSCLIYSIQKINDLVEGPSSNDIITLHAPAQRHVCLAEGTGARDKPHPEPSIRTSPATAVEEELRLSISGTPHVDESNGSGPANVGADNVDNELSVGTQVEATSYDEKDLTRQETQSMQSAGEDGLDVFMLTTGNTTAALDCGRRDAVNDDKDDDTRSLAAFSICSSALTPISSPLTSILDPDDDPIVTFEGLDSPMPVELALPEPPASTSLSRLSSDMPDGVWSASKGLEEIADIPRGSAALVPRQGSISEPIPGPSSSGIESRTVSIDIEEAPRTSSHCPPPASVNEDRPTDKNGLCESEDTRSAKAEVVKAKRNKPNMKDTRDEKADKDGKEEQKEEQLVRPKLKAIVSEECIGGDVDERKEQKPKPKVERKERRKRPREDSTPLPSRASSPSRCCLTSDIASSGPKKKRSRKSNELAVSNLEDAVENSSSRATSEAASSRASSVSPSSESNASEISKDAHIAESDTSMEPEPDSDNGVKEELCGLLIQCMALARASSMPATSLCRDLMRSNPHLVADRSRDALIDLINVVLHAHEVFGRIDREGLDAADKPLEPQWYYIPENDWDRDRATLLREMMPKKRNETKKHKQYYYRPVSKITRWDPEDDI